jgi:hypothetical protein
VSTNRTVVYLVAAQPVGSAELADFRLDLMLEGLKRCELVHSPGQALQVLDDQRAQRGVTLCGSDPGVTVDLVGNRMSAAARPRHNLGQNGQREASR